MTAPDRLTRLSVKSFRRLADVDVPLGPLNVVVGPNGAGKTSVLAVLDVIASSARGHLTNWLSAHGGLSNVITRGAAGALSLDQIRGTLCYHLTLRALGTRHAVAAEQLVSGDNIFIATSSSGEVIAADVNGDLKSVADTHDETVLSRSSLQVHATTKGIRRALASASLFSCSHLDLRANTPLRLPQQVKPDVLPSESGDNLVSCLHSLRELHPESFATLSETLAAAYRDFQELRFPAVANGVLALGWKDRTYKGVFNAHELSDGMLRFLWLVTILHSPELPALLMLDEPETSLHPDLLRLLVDLLREASQRSQIIVATQSESLVRFLRPEEVLILDVQEEGVSLRRADELGLDAWLQEYSLEELWRQNRLGGRA